MIIFLLCSQLENRRVGQRALLACTVRRERERERPYQSLGVPKETLRNPYGIPKESLGIHGSLGIPRKLLGIPKKSFYRNPQEFPS